MKLAGVHLADSEPERPYYEVAVYWPKELAYGEFKKLQTLRAANDRARQLQKLGYGEGRSEIHIIKRFKSKVVKKISG